MHIECHIIQNFPPHCLNRDDTGAPKDCEFGGVRRARISSQCFKRAMREAFEQYAYFTEDQRAVRTRSVVEHVVRLLEAKGREAAAATAAMQALLEDVKLKTKAPAEGGAPRTKYLLFLPRPRLEQLADLVNTHWEALLSEDGDKKSAEKTSATAANKSDAPAGTEEPQPGKRGKVSKRGKSKAAKAKDLAPAARKEAEALLRDARQTPEIALFGRMIADNPTWNVEAACQVAHSISTNRVSMEFDFFTAVDDLASDSDTGAGMLGTIQFNSACFYRYATLDARALRQNLGGKEQAPLTAVAVRAFLEAFVQARPTGKQASMAANTLPDLVLFTVRRSGQTVSLANAFAKPVRQSSDKGLPEASCLALVEYIQRLSKMYPSAPSVATAASVHELDWRGTPVASVASVAAAIDAVCASLEAEAQAA